MGMLRAMTEHVSLDDLKDRGAGQPAPGSVAALYHEAFRRFGAAMLWQWRELERPTIAQALAVAELAAQRGQSRVACAGGADRGGVPCRCLTCSATILLLLAAQRDPESYVAGAGPLNLDGPRYSDDIDMFHDREAAVAAAAEADVALLAAQGFGVQWLRREAGLHAAVITRGDASTRLEWLRDSDFRFFPAVKDALFGYRLHAVDIATNKALASAGRQAPRDVSIFSMSMSTCCRSVP